MFMGSPKADLNLTCGATTASRCSQAQGQVEQEERNLEDSLKKFKYFPVANIGITIGF